MVAPVNIEEEQPVTNMLDPMLSTLQTLLTTTEKPAVPITVVAPVNIAPDQPGVDMLDPMLSTLQSLLTAIEKPGHLVTTGVAPGNAVVSPPLCPEPVVAPPPPCPEPANAPPIETVASQETTASQEITGTNAQDGSIENNEAIQMRKPRARPGQKPADAIEVANIQLDGPENTKTIWVDTQNNEIYNNDAPVQKGAGFL